MTLWADVVDVASGAGFLATLGLSVLLLSIWALTHRRLDKWLATGAAAAAVFGLSVDQSDLALVLIAVSLWLAGELAARAQSRILGMLILVIPSSALGFATGLPQRWPFRVALAMFVPVAWAALWRQDSRSRLAPQLYAISTVGLFATVPNTDASVVLLAALPLVVVPATKRPILLGAGASATLVGLFGWAAAIGGVGRPPSIIGALVGLGVVWVEPLLTWMRRIAVRIGTASDWVDRRLLLAAQATTVAICSRVAGLQTRVEPALVLSIAGLVVGSAFLVRYEGPVKS